jgi:hypothetical protein
LDLLTQKQWHQGKPNTRTLFICLKAICITTYFFLKKTFLILSQGNKNGLAQKYKIKPNLMTKNMPLVFKIAQLGKLLRNLRNYQPIW